ncbi:hypothetical protein [Aquimarina sp. 2201CG14-23]|uniref:hypothetical protein n=1 Tax=Aquimarina mycalae TaxID=3040073 RepID=UPI0024781EBB|nr:hypothetical protein [Aquimarina sp. 2201CG14-23]MDH7448455.1 hypothetical protein [Aquimarina sp. 2201CG14-23]
MSILEKLVNNLDGDYYLDDQKKGHTPGGSFISQNSYGIFKKENYSIKIYCFDNMGVRAVNTFDGSPFKIILILPFALKRAQSIFPKSFFQKIINIPTSKNILSNNAKILLKKYNLKGNKELTNYILNDSFLTEILPNHILYITTKVENDTSILNLRPNESVTTTGELEILYKIMNRLGEIIYEHKSILKK